MDTTAPVFSITAPADNFLTSQSPITVSGTIDDNTATVLVNGTAASVENGSFSVTGITLSEGTNTITVQASDPAGNSNEVSISVSLDTTAPVLTVTTPTHGLLTNQPSLTVSGTVDDSEATVTINDTQAVFNGNDYSLEVTLDEGDNSLQIEASDTIGNTSTASVTVTLDSVAPDISVTAPADGTEIDTATPLITIAFGDSGSGINLESLQIQIDGADKTTLFTKTANDASYQLTGPEALEDGPHQISATVADNAGNSDSATSNFTVTTSHEPPVTETSGFIHGQAFDAATDLPLAEARVTARDIEGEILTDLNGKFSFPTPGSGTFYLTIEKQGYTSAYRNAQVIQTRDVTVASAHLTPKDSKTTLVTPSGATVVDSTGTVELEIPAAAVSQDVEIRITAMKKLEDMPGIQPDFLLFFFSGKFEPSGLRFNTPVTLRVANRLNFDAGMEVPLTRWNEETFVWEEVGLGVVSDDGLWVEGTIDHFTYYHYNGRLKALWPNRIVANNSGDTNDDQELAGCNIPSITQETPLGGLTHVNPQKATDVLIRSKINQTGVAPRRVEWKLSIEGLEKNVTFSGTSAANYQDFMWDTRNGRGEKVPTGSYPFKLETVDVFEPGEYEYRNTLVSINEEVIFQNKTEGRVIVIHETDSPFGTGWVLNGLPRLHFDPDGYIVLTEGNGRGLLFTPVTGSDVYTSPAGDFSVLTKNVDGTYTRRMKNGFKYNFNAAGSLTSKTDRNGNVTAYAYDQDKLNKSGKVIEETDALGNTTYYERGCVCNAPTKITYPSGRVLTMTYDYKGNLLTRTEQATGATTAYTYEPTFNQVASITDPKGNLTQMSYDTNGNLTQIIDAMNNVTTMAYNARGQLTSTTNALSQSTGFSYDQATGYLLSTTDPLGNTTNYTYDAAGNLTGSVDTQGKTTSYSYDIKDRLTGVTDTAGGTTAYEYDTNGNLTKVTDAKGQITTFAYDDKNRLINTTNPANDIKTYVYDAAGNLSSTTDAENRSINYTYNALNRLVQKSLPDNSNVEYEYDVTGNLVKAYAPRTLTYMTYDTPGRLKSSTSVVNVRDDEFSTYVELPDDITISADDDTYDNTDILIVDGATINIAGTHTFKNIAIINGGVLTHPAGSRFDISADSVTVDATSGIDVSNKGYGPGKALGNTTDGASVNGAGGSYGGLGGLKLSSLSRPIINEVKV